MFATLFSRLAIIINITCESFDQNVLICRPLLATFVLLLLEPRTATILVTIAAATSVQQAPHSHAHPTQSPGLDFGSGLSAL